MISYKDLEKIKEYLNSDRENGLINVSEEAIEFYIGVSILGISGGVYEDDHLQSISDELHKTIEFKEIEKNLKSNKNRVPIMILEYMKSTVKEYYDFYRELYEYQAIEEEFTSEWDGLMSEEEVRVEIKESWEDFCNQDTRKLKDKPAWRLHTSGYIDQLCHDGRINEEQASEYDSEGDYASIVDIQKTMKLRIESDLFPKKEKEKKSSKVLKI